MPFSSCSDIEQQLLKAQKSGEGLSPAYASYLKNAACGEFNNVVKIPLWINIFHMHLMDFPLLDFLATLLLCQQSNSAQLQGNGVIQK